MAQNEPLLSVHGQWCLLVFDNSVCPVDLVVFLGADWKCMYTVWAKSLICIYVLYLLQRSTGTCEFHVFVGLSFSSYYRY